MLDWWSWETAGVLVAAWAVISALALVAFSRMATRAEAETAAAREVVLAVGARDGRAARMAYQAGRADEARYASLTASLAHGRGADAIVAELAMRSANVQQKTKGQEVQA